jgi:hypothetical protein
MQVVFFDGGVRSLSSQTSATAVWWPLLTPNARDTPGPY